MNLIRRIAASGTQGGGKTTLARALARVLHTPSITHSRPHAAAVAMGYDRPSSVPASRMREFQEAALAEQLRAEGAALALAGNGIGAFVADRGAVDFAAYYLFQTPGATPGDAYVRRCLEHAATYDLIIYVPPNAAPLEDDGKRHLHGTEEVDALVRMLLAEPALAPRVHAVASDGPENRVQEVMALFR